MLAEYCNSTNPFADSPAATYKYVPKQEQQKDDQSEERATAPNHPVGAFVPVREMQGLSSPWMFAVIPKNESFTTYLNSFEQLNDPQGKTNFVRKVSEFFHALWKKE